MLKSRPFKGLFEYHVYIVTKDGTAYKLPAFMGHKPMLQGYLKSEKVMVRELALDEIDCESCREVCISLGRLKGLRKIYKIEGLKKIGFQGGIQNFI